MFIYFLIVADLQNGSGMRVEVVLNGRKKGGESFSSGRDRAFIFTMVQDRIFFCRSGIEQE